MCMRLSSSAHSEGQQRGQLNILPRASAQHRALTERMPEKTDSQATATKTRLCLATRPCHTAALLPQGHLNSSIERKKPRFFNQSNLGSNPT